MSYINDFRPELSSGMYSFTKQVFSDEATRARIQRHLYDQHDIITDADIENIKTSMSEVTWEDFQQEKGE